LQSAAALAVFLAAGQAASIQSRATTCNGYAEVRLRPGSSTSSDFLASFVKKAMVPFHMSAHMIRMP
jgi:hypothetical protein